eukprot:TRINITY_DN39620_c0_g1_i1.p1 TRINITY_DN39620_c0_g1~~TRINITY_DN39620_c0_g1_i1.p1  ORF type:complete len:297 (-),score=59.86 TRINITY_DN39620_c0_g1_i1:78-968(-)
MADRVKEMQRSDPTARDQWYAYCETYGEGIRDPNKHSQAFLEGFITSYNNGERFEFKEGEALVKFIKLGQKKSAGWKLVWEEYCRDKLVDGKTAHDPAKHTFSHLEGFFDFIGKRAAVGSAAPAALAPLAAPAGKRTRLDTAGSWVPAGGVVDWVAKIKEYQRQGAEQKDAWHSYCDQHLHGMRDPSKHDAATLQHFLASRGVSVATPPPLPVPVPMMPSPYGYAPYGAMPPAAGMVPPATTLSQLAARIKDYQRQGDTQKQTWHNYCDMNLGGVRDPNRHDVQTLQAFIHEYGVR